MTALLAAGGRKMANFTGGGADETFVGTVDPDTASGNGGNDTLFGLGGNDSLNGGDDDDTLDGGDNNDVLTGGAGKDSLAGGNGDDTLYSHAPDPAYFGYRGVSYDVFAEVDILNGGSGNDGLFAGYGDSVDGGANDAYGDKLYISFRGAPSGVTADFRLLNTQSSITIGGGTIKNIEEVSYLEGSEFDDLLATWGGGYTNGQSIFGRGGNDQIYAGYYAGFGDLGIHGGDGDDYIDLTGAGYGPLTTGDAGDDYIIGGSSYERLEGGEGNDRIEGNYGYDNLYGGGGNDVIDGGSFDDNLYGEGGNDTLYGAGDVDTIDGGEGNDIIYGDFSLISSAGGISGGPRFETLRGGAGDDFVSGDGGDDRLYGDDGDDLLSGGTGDDSMSGGAGIDRMDGGDGNDTGYGGAGDDLILSGTGNDQLSGEEDNDRLYFGATFGASDLAAGGAGADELILQGNYAGLTLASANTVQIETVRLLSAADASIVAAPGGSFSYALVAADSLVAAGGALAVDASGLAAGETLSFDGSAEANGALTVKGGAGADLIVTGGGNDVLDGGGAADMLQGRAGNDVYHVDHAGDVVTENAGEGTDEVRTSLAIYSLLGSNVENLTATSGAAHDLQGSAADNVLTGGAGNDLLRLNDGGNDTASGGAGNDIVYFGASFTGADVADGGADRDVLVLQGNYNLTLSASNIANLESISLQSGARTTWGDLANNFYDYNLTMAEANVPAGVQLIVNGQSLRVGEDLTFDGSAETDGRFLVYAGHGVDTLKGGAGNDVFYFEGQRLQAGDTVDGGGGRDAVIISSGNGVNRFEFTDSSFTSIESISVNNRFATDPSQKPSYELILANGNVAAGATLILNGNSIADPAQTVLFDASAVQAGKLSMFAGAGADTLIGGAGADLLYGAGGGDSLTGGGGADMFQYRSASESTAADPDEILDFEAGADKIDLHFIDANTAAAGDQAFSFIGANAFSGSAGELRAYESNGSWFVEGDVDGDQVADLVIMVTTGSTPMVASDFIV